MPILTAEAVRSLTDYCLVEGDKDVVGALVVEGILNSFAFHPERLKEKKGEIKTLLSELPEQFQNEKGGGWTFLNACVDKNGNHWGEHIDMEALFALGIGTDQAVWVFPRDMWEVLPGGVPYVVVKLNEEKKDDVSSASNH